MSAALYIVLERDIPEFDAFVNGKALSSAENQLDRAAEELGVTPLMAFFSMDPQEAMDFLEGEPEANGDVPDLPAEQWFDARDGLATVRALRQHLDKNPKAVRNSEAVVRDLGEFETVLQRAASAEVRWHLAVDF